jgi:hypothetical protein
MTVVVQFGSVVMMGADRLPVTGKRKVSVPITLSDQVLLDGRHNLMGSTRTGWKGTYACMGPYANFLALVGLVGTQQTLTVSGTPAGTLTKTKCMISDISAEESEDPNSYYWNVTFSQDTTI